MATGTENKTAVWVLTAQAMGLAGRLTAARSDTVVLCSQRLACKADGVPVVVFDRLTEKVAECFPLYQAHIFIMAAGIVVRAIAPHIRLKTKDPAVVVVDDRGRFAVSLLSGHLGGANALARQVADELAGTAVITTATDINGKSAIDQLAGEAGLAIENPGAIKTVNMALLNDQPIAVCDPEGWLTGRIPGAVPQTISPFDEFNDDVGGAAALSAAVLIDDRQHRPRPGVLMLRPPSFCIGIGCNRGTPRQEIKDLLDQVLAQFALSTLSLAALATIELKADETGLLELAKELDLPLYFYSKQELTMVDGVPSPSDMVTKHIGVPSVCEPAALLAARKGLRRGTLIVPKQKTKNVTLAVARRSLWNPVFTSSA